MKKNSGERSQSKDLENTGIVVAASSYIASSSTYSLSSVCFVFTTTMASFDDEFSQLKAVGNNHYTSSQFAEADEIYTDLLMRFPDRDRVIILTNRSATRLSLGRLQESLDDANAAIQLDKKWVKAYYRKATALEKLGMFKDSYDAWAACAIHCDPESSPWLSDQIIKAREQWKRIFRDIPIVDSDDFIERYELLDDSRDKLSTLAHFWNASTNEERHNHFRFLISVIGGESDMSEQNKNITANMMVAMPLQNYEDKQRSAIELWCQFFESLDPESKTLLLVRIWSVLGDAEQHAVIVDLRLFVSMAMQGGGGGGGGKPSGDSPVRSQNR